MARTRGATTISPVPVREGSGAAVPDAQASQATKTASPEKSAKSIAPFPVSVPAPSPPRSACGAARTPATRPAACDPRA